MQDRFDRGGKRSGLLGAANKMKYWDLYGELYHTLKQNPKDDFPHTFVEEFARAYEGKLAELTNRRARTTHRRSGTTSHASGPREPRAATRARPLARSFDSAR